MAEPIPSLMSAPLLGPDEPKPKEPREAPRARSLADANRSARKLAALFDARAEVVQTHALRLEEVTREVNEWRDAELRSLDLEIENEKAYLLPFAEERVASDPRGKKSVNLEGRVVVGWRAQDPEVRVVDAKAAVDFLRERGRLDLIREPKPVEPAPGLVEIEKLGVSGGAFVIPGPEPGELVPIPGIEVKVKDDKYYLRVGSR